MVQGLNKKMGLAWSQIPQKPRPLHEQMAVLRNMRQRVENFLVLNQETNDSEPKNQNAYQNEDNNNNTRGGQRVNKHG